MLYTWHCNRFIYRRWWWALLRRNAYNHHLHGRVHWRWTNSYKRIGNHRYRYQALYRNYQGRWRRIGGKWRLNRRNAYNRKSRWFWTRRTKRVGNRQYRFYRLMRWTGSHWRQIRGYWHRIRGGGTLVQASKQTSAAKNTRHATPSPSSSSESSSSESSRRDRE